MYRILLPPQRVTKKAHVKWSGGMWLGKSSECGTHIIGIRDGIDTARTVRRHKRAKRKQNEESIR